MYRTIAIALLLFMQSGGLVSASSSCSGAGPAIVSVAVNASNALNRYELTGTVVNLGSAAQPYNTVQSVDIFSNGVKLDTKSIPPLQAGESYVFSYGSERPSAGTGTTKLRFQIDVAQPASAGSQDCNAKSGYTVTL